MALFKNQKTNHRNNSGWVQTDDTGGRVHCRICGRPVRSRLGDTCSRTSCQHKALGRAGMLDEFGE